MCKQNCKQNWLVKYKKCSFFEGEASFHQEVCRCSFHSPLVTSGSAPPLDDEHTDDDNDDECDDDDDDVIAYVISS